MTFLITLFAFILTGYATLRMRPKNPITAVLTLLGYGLTFIIILTLFKSVLPRYFVSSLPSFQDNWSPVWQEAAGVGNGAVQRVNGWLDLDVPEISVERAADAAVIGTELVAETAAADGTAVVAETAVTAGVSVSPVITASVTPALNPTPTVTETRKLSLYDALRAAHSSNDRQMTAVALAELLALDPYDAFAAQTRRLLQTADARLTTYQILASLPLQISKRDDWQQQVGETLRGGRYYVQSNGATLLNFACQEHATLRDETPGYTYGATFTVPRCYLEPFKATKTGVRFSGQ